MKLALAQSTAVSEALALAFPTTYQQMDSKHWFHSVQPTPRDTHKGSAALSQVKLHTHKLQHTQKAEVNVRSCAFSALYRLQRPRSPTTNIQGAACTTFPSSASSARTCMVWSLQRSHSGRSCTDALSTQEDSPFEPQRPTDSNSFHSPRTRQQLFS